MENLRDLFEKEPALVRGLILSIFGLLASAGLPIPPELQEGIITFLLTSAPLILGLLIRGKVSPTNPPTDTHSEVIHNTDTDLDWPIPDPETAVPGTLAEIQFGFQSTQSR